MDTAHVDVDVQMVGEGDTPSDEVGFPCSSPVDEVLTLLPLRPWPILGSSSLTARLTERRLSTFCSLRTALTVPLTPSPCSSPWSLARQRLAALIQKADQQSLYNSDLLIVHCPDRSLLPDAEAALKTKVNRVASFCAELELTLSFSPQLLSDLAISSLSSLKSTSVLLARLQDAESQLACALAGPLSTVDVRKERVLKPLYSTFPCLSTLCFPS